MMHTANVYNKQPYKLKPNSSTVLSGSGTTNMKFLRNLEKENFELYNVRKKRLERAKNIKQIEHEVFIFFYFFFILLFFYLLKNYL